MSAIGLCVRRAISPRCLNVLLLHRRRRRVSSAHSCSFHRSGIVPNAARAAVVGHAGVVRDRVLANDGFIHVGVVDDRGIHPHHRRVVLKGSAAPFSTDKADAHVSEAVINSAVITDSIAPVTIVEDVVSAFPTPPRRSPQCAHIGRGHPFSRNPVVAVISPCPVAGRPHPAFFWTERLLIDGQQRRSNRD